MKGIEDEDESEDEDDLDEMRRALRQTLIALKAPDEQIDRLALRDV